MRRKANAYDLELQRKADAFAATQVYLCHDDCDAPTGSTIIETCSWCGREIQARYMAPSHKVCNSCREKICDLSWLVSSNG